MLLKLCNLKEKYINSIYFQRLIHPNDGPYYKHTFPDFLRNLLPFFPIIVHKVFIKDL